ncbi:hypothetical protein BJF85_20150 [Saccharomonospora sp. CUA-673]|uniref:YbaB/EbfC family nucleoid-associated protein n=1 Tax=Saccharomonospora sp. CUA-673 TaxID=1904969 RepID=UPI00095F4B88|nr:YbaB/EbfC family nucleoid-associated protein [Saccharomonospora sp. CUA-673]OLT44196.1 hypothetical protein BJF85_20150 [Saccharomonospora sp. CUA-673]
MPNTTNRDLIERARHQAQQARDKQAEWGELLSSLEGAKHEFDALEVRATSPDGTVTVTVGAGGIVRSVELADNAVHGNARTLTASINATITQAITQATAKQAEVVERHVGQRPGGDAIGSEQILGPLSKFTAAPARNTESGIPAPSHQRTAPAADPFTDPLAHPQSTAQSAASGPPSESSGGASSAGATHGDDPFHDPLRLR